MVIRVGRFTILRGIKGLRSAPGLIALECGETNFDSAGFLPVRKKGA